MSKREDNARRPKAVSDYEAVILDLDGVVTETVSLHRAAWKEVFDRFLSEEDPDQPPFDADADYRRHVDGRPRFDGVRRFLESRNIDLPEGDDDDTLEDRTIRGVGNAKNERFRQLLGQRGANVFDHAVAAIRRWKAQGLPVAIVSASRNCAAILESAGLSDLFDARVDGNTLDELNMRGKPEPDMYLEAARRLSVSPHRAVVFEDAIAGVEAAKRGQFGLVVGVGPDELHEELRKRGADFVVNTVGEFAQTESRQVDHDSCQMMCLLDSLDDFAARLRDRTPALFLDYDGTLTPIVERPELAKLDDEMRNVLRRLAEACMVAIVSGRDRANVEKLVNLDGLIFAGSHGFDIRGPDELAIEHSVGEAATVQLDKLERNLQKGLESIEGAQIERKRFSIAVHYRNVDESDVPRIEQAVDESISRAEGMVKNRGKKVFEIQPDIDWDKGKAVLWLLDALELDLDDVLPIYIGDDLTDEDAFDALRGRGIGIVVGLEDRHSKADYCLHSVDEVQKFLGWMHEQLKRAQR